MYEIKMNRLGRKGQTMTEYILIVALIAIACIFAVKMFGGKVKTGFTSAADKVATETNK